jgi:hypothetical protein
LNIAKESGSDYNKRVIDHSQNMVTPRTAPRPRWQAGTKSIAFFLIAIISLAALPARAVLQFDVFLGYDGVVPEASWFPVVCEIKNDGPGFVGVIEVTAGHFNESQTRRLVVELPTGTLKRVTIPVFSTARYSSSWDVRLLDERGKVRSEQVNVRPKRESAASNLLIGALPRTATGVPSLRPTVARDPEYQPATARLQTSLLPDNPLVFEGLDVIYLNSEKASELSAHQVGALLAWLNDGGHLIVGIEQLTDVNAVAWLKNIVPAELTDMHSITDHPELLSWLRGSTATGSGAKTGKPYRGRMNQPADMSYGNPYSDLREDTNFEQNEIRVATGTVRNGDVVVASGDYPLILSSRQGRGHVTTLLFSPEREPFRSWKNLPTFWSRITEVPTELYQTGNNNMMRGGWSIDGVFGAMVDSKQVRKLPVEYLLLLLIAYLVVIGPLDQYWLKRIRRPMLTWITFPCYVVVFSLLIYFIGYRLRAGETEWNELHLVDVLPTGEGAELRGHTYASVYSPVNATYRVESEQEFATFRGEFQTSWNGGGGDQSEHAEVVQNGDNYKAEIFVPVWTSQLYVSDWWEPASLPLKLDVTSDGPDNYSVEVQNFRDRALTNAHLVIGNRMMELGELPAGQKKTFKLSRQQGMSLDDYVRRFGSGFQNAASERQRAFSSGSGRIDDLYDSSAAISFISHMSEERFITPPGLDLSAVLRQGNAVLLAWEPGYSPIKPVNQFPTRRSHKDTLWRIAAPITINAQ